MNMDEAKKILEIMTYADGSCVYCARELFFQFIREFPEFVDLAKEIFKRNFNEELENFEVKDLLRNRINCVMKGGGCEVSRIILFGSRARGNFEKQSDWDMIVVIKNNLSIREKMFYSKRIRQSVAQLGIDCDVIIKSEEEIEQDKEMIGSVVREALKEGTSI